MDVCQFWGGLTDRTETMTVDYSGTLVEGIFWQNVGALKGTDKRT